MEVGNSRPETGICGGTTTGYAVYQKEVRLTLSPPSTGRKKLFAGQSGVSGKSEFVRSRKGVRPDAKGLKPYRSPAGTRPFRAPPNPKGVGWNPPTASTWALARIASSRPTAQ